MKNFKVLKYSAILLPALAMGVSTASAGDDKRNDPCNKDQTAATATAKQDHGENRGPIVAGNAPTTVTRAEAAAKGDYETQDESNSWDDAETSDEFASSDEFETSDDTSTWDESETSDEFASSDEFETSDETSTWDESNTTLNAGMNNETYLATVPANNFFSSNLVGQEVKNSRNDEVVGTVEEILIDQDGQVGAVVLSTGGLMGLGEKDVAISWDQITRTTGEDDEIELTVDFSEASIADAPTFDRDDNDDNDRN